MALDAETSDLSWRIISAIYGTGCVCCAALYLAERAEWYGDTFVNSYLICVPFVPCLLFSLAKWRLQASIPPLPAREESKKER